MAIATVLQVGPTPHRTTVAGEGPLGLSPDDSATARGYRAVATLYHAYLTGLILTVGDTLRSYRTRQSSNPKDYSAARTSRSRARSTSGSPAATSDVMSPTASMSWMWTRSFRR